MILLFIILAGLVLYFAMNMFRKFKLLDDPKKYGFKRKPVPYSFGIVFYFLFVIGAWFLGVDLLAYWPLMLASGLIVSVAFLDDKYSISPIIRLLVQVLAACFLVYWGVEIKVLTNPLNFEIIDLKSLSFLISVVWLVFLTNVMNFLDGVEGSSSGVSAVAFATIGVLTLLPNLHVIDQGDLTILSFLMAALAFVAFCLEFPRPFPKLLVGDSGTMLYGFLLASFSMLSGGKLFTLLIVLLVPILDALFVIFYRIRIGKTPFKGDFNHFHHKLLGLRIKRSSITLIYFAVS